MILRLGVFFGGVFFVFFFLLEKRCLAQSALRVRRCCSLPPQIPPRCHIKTYLAIKQIWWWHKAETLSDRPRCSLSLSLCFIPRLLCCFLLILFRSVWMPLPTRSAFVFYISSRSCLRPRPSCHHWRYFLNVFILLGERCLHTADASLFFWFKWSHHLAKNK